MSYIRLIVICVMGLCAGFGIRAWFARSDSGPPIKAGTVAAVTPLLKQDSKSVKPRQTVELHYSIRNVGKQPLDGLKLDLSCDCQIRQALPSTLAPGASAEFAFAMSAPEFGVLKRNVDLRAAGHASPVATIPVRLEVPANAPRLLTVPPSIVIDWVRGATPSAVVQFETIEETTSDPWLTKLVIDGNNGLVLADWTHNDRVGVDRTMCRRSYRGVLTWAAMPRDGITATLRLKRSTTDTGDEPAVPITIRPLDRLAAFPAQVRLSKATDSEAAPTARVTLVDRLHGRGLVLGEYDNQRLVVEPLDGSGANSFRVTLRDNAAFDSGETEVTFVTTDGETVRVPVTLVAAVTSTAPTAPIRSEAP